MYASISISCSIEGIMKKKLFVLITSLTLNGCTLGQRFDLLKNQRLDECAMMRMAESKFNSQIGYLQAHHECHDIVNFQKFRAMKLANKAPSDQIDQIDAFDKYRFCMNYIKNIYADKYYPDLRLPKESNYKTNSKEDEKIRNSVSTLREFVLPEKFSKLGNERLLMLRDAMATKFGSPDECPESSYNELQHIVNLELHKRNTFGSN